jgi:hypothetical protein
MGRLPVDRRKRCSILVFGSLGPFSTVSAGFAAGTSAAAKSRGCLILQVCPGKRLRRLQQTAKRHMNKPARSAIAFGCILAVPACFDAAARAPGAGPVIGHIDGIAVDASGAHIRGWACQKGRPESIVVHIYAGGGAAGADKAILALPGKADLDEEAAVDAACGDTQGRD